MAFSLKDDIDTAALAAHYKTHGFAQIPEFLEEDDANAVMTGMVRAAGWRMVFLSDKKPDSVPADRINSMTDRNKTKLSNRVYMGAAEGRQYVYQALPLDIGRENQPGTDHPAFALMDLLRSAEMLDMVKAITGEAALASPSVAGRYFNYNQFDTQHRGQDDNPAHRVGFELQLSPLWRDDFGGYTLFYDDQAEIEAGIFPRFRQLTLFSAEKRVATAAIAPFANRVRISVNGWFNAG